MIHSSSNNNLQYTKLNELIFNSSVSVHLLNQNYNSFATILEYSLLSKRCFKIFQYLILSSHKFIFPINSFIKYIITNNNNNNNNNNNTYINQLIQYKNIERIKIQYISKMDFSFIDNVNQKNNKRKRESDDQIEQENQKKLIKKITKLHNRYKFSGDSTPILKRILNYYCPCLKKVTVVSEKIKTNMFELNNFFKFKKLSLYWACNDLPDDYDNIPDEFKDEDDYPWEKYEFTFSFISDYNPSKIYISTPGSGSGGDLELQLENINNLLNFKSIKSIHFDQHITPYSFITTVFQSTPDSSNLRSLYLNMQGSGKAILNSEIHSNKTIKKLILKRNEDPSLMISEFLQLIQSNSTLTTLGLHYFLVENSNQLLPLAQIKNINTLYCICDPVSLGVYFDHCNENSNLKKLVIYTQSNHYIDDKVLKLFENFIKNNNSSLESIKIIYVEYLPTDKKMKELDTKPFNDLLQANNYNNNGTGSKHIELLFSFKED